MLVKYKQSSTSQSSTYNQSTCNEATTKNIEAHARSSISNQTIATISSSQQHFFIKSLKQQTNQARNQRRIGRDLESKHHQIQISIQFLNQR